jgi:hypothetical protein
MTSMSPTAASSPREADGGSLIPSHQYAAAMIKSVMV